MFQEDLLDTMKIEVNEVEFQEQDTRIDVVYSSSSARNVKIETNSQTKDACDLFGEYVAAELRSLPELERSELQQVIIESISKHVCL